MQKFNCGSFPPESAVWVPSLLRRGWWWSCCDDGVCVCVWPEPACGGDRERHEGCISGQQEKYSRLWLTLTDSTVVVIAVLLNNRQNNGRRSKHARLLSTVAVGGPQWGPWVFRRMARFLLLFYGTARPLLGGRWIDGLWGNANRLLFAHLARERRVINSADEERIRLAPRSAGQVGCGIANMGGRAPPPPQKMLISSVWTVTITDLLSCVAG